MATKTYIEPYAPAGGRDGTDLLPAATVTGRPLRNVTSVAQVRAQWAQNLGGGLGAASIVAAVWIALHRVGMALDFHAAPWPAWESVGVAAGVVAAGVFGWLMFVTASYDELVKSRTVMDWNQLVDQCAALEAANRDQLERIALLEQERLTLEAELRIAQNKTAPDRTFVPATSPDLKVYADALALAERAIGGKPWGRDYMRKTHGWGQTRWEKAQAKLVASKIVTYNGREPVVVSRNRADAAAAIERLKGREAAAAVGGRDTYVEPEP